VRHETRLRSSLALVSITLFGSACVSIGPVASGPVPTVVPTIPGSTAVASALATVAPPTTPPITAPPPTPTNAPTATPTIAPTATPTIAPSGTPTNAPTATPTDAPTDAPTATPVEQLNFRLDPTYGLVELAAGFVPDPHSKEMLAGGSVDASYLGDGCRGFATSAPDYSVRYTADDRALLRLYFLASDDGDATMIINDPEGQWLCSDDWDGTTRDPGIDITEPQSGRYDIWVGSFVSGTTVDGVLHVTELESNQP